ncbi:MAG: protein phosphatase 2C domain-containing protein [Candidatus Obscuribacterales bacterium]|nr:protein phosphatase 2C domain-containing protein [Candidatus Obscuribacterales bacterium]
MKNKFESAIATHIGCLRKENQDSGFVSRDRRILCVSDGMGGHNGGGRASKLAIAAIRRNSRVGMLPDYTNKQAVATWAEEAIQEANAEIWLAARKSRSLKDMGTTIVLIVLADGFAHVAHLGDSRAYRLRNGRLYRLTSDHSSVQELIDSGKLRNADRNKHLDLHEVTRWLPDRQVVIQHRRLLANTGDIYLLTSDGLTDVVSDIEIKQALKGRLGLKRKLTKLVRQTLKAGAPDNVTVALSQNG